MTNQVIKKRKYKSWLIGLFIITVLSVIIYFNLNKTYFVYEYLFKIPHFSKGDKVYAKHDGALGLCRLVRPLTEADIDTMQISDAEKLRLQLSLKDLPGPYVINVEDHVSTIEKSNYIGKCLGHKIFNTKTYDTKKRAIVNMIIIQIDKSQIGTTDYLKEFKLPRGYTWANNTYYLYAASVSDTETFKVTNPSSQKKD